MQKIQDPQDSQKQPGTVRGFFENLLPLALALFLVFVVRSSVFESFKIPSGSMIPTLAIGDYLFVNKFAYGFKLPFSDWLMDHPVYLVERAPPKRGDVIVFRFPRDESIYFIKRIVGVPGDTVELRERALYLNGKAVPRVAMPAEKIKEVMDGEVLKDPQYTVTDAQFYLESLPRENGAIEHMMMIDKSSPASGNFGPVTVPADSLFAMGDNRDVSNDSRFWGFVPLKNVTGKAMAIWFSFWPVSLSDGQYYFHPSRIGTSVR
jgi:signal peptidase I